MSEFNHNQSSQNIDTNQISDGLKNEAELGKKAYKKARDFYNSKKAAQGASAVGKGATASSSGASTGASGVASASGGAGGATGATIGGVPIGTIFLVIIIIELIIILIGVAFDSASSMKLQDDKEAQRVAYEQMQDLINETYKDNINGLESAFKTHINETYDCEASSVSHSITQTGGQFSVKNDKCSITLNYYPPVEDLSKVIIAQASSINGVISAYTPQEYQEGVWGGYEDINTHENIDYTLIQVNGERDAIIKEKLFEDGDEYTSVTNQKFLNDFKTEISTKDIFSLKNEEGEYGWFSSVSTEEIEEEVCYLTTEEGEPGAEILSTQKVNCDDYSENDVDKQIETRKFSSGVINGNIYLNMDNYHREELKNIAKAYASHDQGVTEDEAYKKLIEHASALYEQFIKNFDIEDSARVVMSGQASEDSLSSSYTSAYDGSFKVGAAKKTIDGAIDFEAYAAPSGTVNSPQEAYTLWKTMESTPGFSTGAVPNNCTYFVAYEFFITYGHNWTHGDGKDVALNLCAEHPEEFVCGLTPAPGGVVSTPAVFTPEYVNPYGHILFINEVKEDGTVVISDANILRYKGEAPGQATAGMRIRREVNWNTILADGVVSVAIPRK